MENLLCDSFVDVVNCVTFVRKYCGFGVVCVAFSGSQYWCYGCKCFECFAVWFEFGIAL